ASFPNYAPSLLRSPLSLHDALPICLGRVRLTGGRPHTAPYPAVVEFRKGLLEAGQVVLAARLLEQAVHFVAVHDQRPAGVLGQRSEEHTSELQSRENLVCRLLLEKK